MPLGKRELVDKLKRMRVRRLAVRNYDSQSVKCCGEYFSEKGKILRSSIDYSVLKFVTANSP